MKRLSEPNGTDYALFEAVMADRQRLWLLPFLGIAIVAIVLLAAGLPQFELRPGQPFPFQILIGQQSGDATGEPIPAPTLPLPFLNLWAMVFVVAFMILAALWIVTFILRPQARKRMLARLASYVIWFLMFYLIFNVIWQLDLTGGNEGEEGSAGTELGELLNQGEEMPTPPVFIVDPPQWFIIVITLTILALLLGLAWYVWQRRSSSEAQPVDKIVREAQQAIDEIHTGRELKDTVMRCYQEMSRVLGDRRGIERQKAMTPREFEEHLTKIGLRSEHIHRLTRLFEGVRYGAHVPGKREEREAVACLSAIVEAYGPSS